MTKVPEGFLYFPICALRSQTYEKRLQEYSSELEKIKLELLSNFKDKDEYFISRCKDKFDQDIRQILGFKTLDPKKEETYEKSPISFSEGSDSEQYSEELEDLEYLSNSIEFIAYQKKLFKPSPYAYLYIKIKPEN